ncbi:hypothetical protein BBROOKSOX_705 [Bathymodiolus brooksi thiotrophic gill symbiont]|jgi:hypothetical protein|nr:hypothetical protein BROOK1789B_1043 [Bathymodiolus brooksi thiotrophic gill symbiont]SHE22658.1 hypothetical protein BBROOKSOX_705 [Bathymodiolus brooksi thiotrophic gill symbiont]
MNNPEKLAIYGTQDEKRKQNKDTTQYVLDSHTTICYQTQIT